MTSTAPERRYTFREYLELEASSELRYEFFAGAVYAMSGGSPEHSGLAAIIVEVLSPSTQRYDREERAAHYRRIPSLASYVLISREEQRLEVFTRNPDGSWTLREARIGSVELPSIGCKLAVAEVYRNPLEA